MPQYVYKAIGADGVEVEGRVSGASEADAIRQLEAQRIAPYRIQLDSNLSARKFQKQRASFKDRQRFMRQLSTLLRAGVPLLEGFRTVTETEPCRDLYSQASKVASDLRAGGRLSLAMQSHFDRLPPYAVRLIELGEATGSLPERLVEIADQMAQEQTARDELRNALSYPAFLAIAGVAAVFFIFLFVVPRFAGLVDSSRAQIPLISQVVLSAGVGMRDHLWAVLTVIVSAVLIIVLILRTPRFRDGALALAYRMPVLGSFLRSAETARWARICGVALGAGAPITDALILAENSVWSARRRRGLSDARRAVRAGEPLDVALKAHTDMDAMTVNLVRTGRMSGEMAEMLDFAATGLENEARNQAKRLSAIAEPLAVMVIAGVIGVVVVSLVLAMTSLYEAVNF